MPNGSDSEDSESNLLCAPLKKSKGLGLIANCNDSVTFSTQRSTVTTSKLRLSLSQRKRQYPTPPKQESGACCSDNDDDFIPLSQKYLKSNNMPPDSAESLRKKPKLDFCLDDSEPELECPTPPLIHQDILLSPNQGSKSNSSTLKASGLFSNRASFVLDDIPGPSTSRANQENVNDARHAKTDKSQDNVDENTNKNSQSTILSFDLTPKRKVSNVLDSSMASDERALRLLQTSFLAAGNSKQDFVKQWLDSCSPEPDTGPMETEDFIEQAAINQCTDDMTQPVSSGSETQPLVTDYLVLELSNEEKSSPHTPKKTVPPLPTVNEDGPVTSTSGVISTCTASLSLVTPPKNIAQNQKTSTGSSKQTMLTDFYTPCAKTPAKALPKGDIARLQMSTNISELAQPVIDELTYVETESIQTSSLKSTTPAEAKAQWSQLMSKMRGSANNLRREIKQSDKRRTTRFTAPEQANHSETVEVKPSDRRCPFYKRIPGTNFVVDAFNYGRIQGVTCYFLSHFHYDHYQGLGKWIDKPLYCSKVTANLIQLKMKLDPKLIRVLPLNESRVIENVEVVLIDANHCPGSVMFLFRFPTGRCVLHVGDFRAHPSMETVRELTRSPISELYLDTTYCDPNYELPPQDEVIAYVRRLVRKHVQRHPKLLVVSGTYTIGKEKVFMAAAEELDCKIWAPTGKRTILNCIEEPELKKRLVTNPTEDRVGIHVVNMSDVNPRNLKNYLETLNGRYSHILALNPTGWEYDGKMAIKGLDGIQPKVYQGSIFIYGVPYSEHSGFTEMRRFVKFFKPAKIIPTVNVGSAQQRQKMESIFSEWLGRKTRL